MLGLALAALLPSHATAHAVRGALAPSDTRDAPSRTVRRRDAVDAASADESAAAARVASARAARRRVGFVRYARELVAGGVAEAMMDAALFPVDTLKARRQAFQRHRLPTARKPSMRELMALGNPLRGIGPAFLSALPAGASFVSAKWCMEMLAHRAMNSTGHGWAVTMAASACADVAYWAVRFPAETGRLRVQALQDRSTLAAIGRLLVDGGYRPSVLYRGWQTVLWRDVPYDALEFGFYEISRALLARLRRPDEKRRAHGQCDDNRLESAICGAVSALCAAILTTPLDVARTRVMTQRLGAPGAYAGVLDCVVRVLRTEGPAALFVGLGERALMASVGGAIWFFAYELIRIGPPDGE